MILVRSAHAGTACSSPADAGHSRDVLTESKPLIGAAVDASDSRKGGLTYEDNNDTAGGPEEVEPH